MPRIFSKRRFNTSGVALVVIGLMGIGFLDAQAQTDGSTASRALSIIPEVLVSQTFTDNARLSSNDHQFESITQVSPALHFRSSAGRVQGFADYSLSGLIYARGTASNSVQQTLNSDLKAEVISNFAYLNASANISQQNISAFGTQSPDASLRSANQTEVSSFNLAPYIKGRLAGLANYEARLNYSATHSAAAGFGNSTRAGGSVRVGSDSSQARINWAVDASRQTTDFSGGRNTESDLATGSLIFAATPELRVSARGGRESNNIASFERRAGTTYGIGARWTPSERTLLSGDRDERFFGGSHSVRFLHRTPRTVWAFSDTRDISTDSDSAARSLRLTEFDLLFLSLTSKFPDPTFRAQEALSQLRALGVNPGAIAQGGFLIGAVSLQRRQDFSVALNGLRNSAIVSAFQTETRRLDSLSPVIDPLTGGKTIRQHGFGLALLHKLTPESSVNLNTTQTRTSDALTGAATKLLSVTATWTARFGKRTGVSLGARRVVSDSDFSPYTESALIGTLSLQF